MRVMSRMFHGALDPPETKTSSFKIQIGKTGESSESRSARIVQPIMRGAGGPRVCSLEAWEFAQAIRSESLPSWSMQIQRASPAGMLGLSKPGCKLSDETGIIL